MQSVRRRRSGMKSHLAPQHPLPRGPRPARVGALRLLCAAAALTSCVATGALPPHHVENGAGIVYAQDPATAARFAALVTRAVEPVHAALPGLPVRFVDLRVVESLADVSAHGLVFPEHIELDQELPPDGELFILAHELAHYFCDPTWKRLPHVLEEGLCDWVAMRVDPEHGVQRRAEHLILVATASTGGLRLEVPVAGTRRQRTFRFRTDLSTDSLPDPVALLDLDGDAIEALQASPASVAIYAIGWLFVETIGPAALRRLCERAADEGLDQVPAHWVLDAADFGTRPRAQWWPAVEHLLGPEERAWVLALALAEDRDDSERQTGTR